MTQDGVAVLCAQAAHQCNPEAGWPTSELKKNAESVWWYLNMNQEINTITAPSTPRPST